ncbi:hypothetical protein [Natronomonas sp.]|uniref:hypothetical protein n=1 Tax=Natronomonas sp. TaxID=2184060 RepID=UPI00261C87A7|nr:hypothetical protein [Natronomonas sp.]
MADGTREARVSHDGDGDPIGAAVFLTPEDLAALGVDTEAVNRVQYTVINGRLHLGSMTGGEVDTSDKAEAGAQG